jgi:hypothetical protein
MDATTTPETPDRPFLTFAEAGATIARSASYVRTLLQRLPGAPTAIVLRCPTTDGSTGRAHRLVDRDEWFAWVRDQREAAVGRGEPMAGTAVAFEPVPTLPAILLPPSQRRNRGAR